MYKLLILGLFVFASCDGVNFQKKGSDNAKAATEKKIDDTDKDEVKKADVVKTAEGEKCGLIEGADNNPTTIKEFIGYVNNLTKPVDVLCVVENLKRPLYVSASSDIASGQPASKKEDSPRVMIRLGDSMIISILARDDLGVGKNNEIELSEMLKPGMSTKGSLHFPVNDTLTDGSPFMGLMSNKGAPSAEGGACAALCHSGAFEVVKDHGNGAIEYLSTFIPTRENNIVSGFDLEFFWDQCSDSGSTSMICSFYRAIYGHGDVKYYSLDDM